MGKKNLFGTIEEEPDRARAQVSEYAWARGGPRDLDDQQWNREFTKHMKARSEKLFGKVKKAR